MQDRAGRDDVRLRGDPHRVSRRERPRQRRQGGGGLRRGLKERLKVPEPVRRLLEEFQEAERFGATRSHTYRRETVLL